MNEVHLNIARHLATGIPKLDVAINPSPSQRYHTAPVTHAVITHCYGISTYGMLTQSRLTKRFGPIEAVPLRNAYDLFLRTTILLQTTLCDYPILRSLSNYVDSKEWASFCLQYLALFQLRKPRFVFVNALHSTASGNHSLYPRCLEDDLVYMRCPHKGFPPLFFFLSPTIYPYSKASRQ